MDDVTDVQQQAADVVVGNVTPLPLRRNERCATESRASCVTSSCLARKSLIAAFTCCGGQGRAAREFDQVLLKVAPMFSLVLIPSEARGQHVERDLVGVPRHEPQCADRRTHSLRVIQQSPGLPACRRGATQLGARPNCRSRATTAAVRPTPGGCLQHQHVVPRIANIPTVSLTPSGRWLRSRSAKRSSVQNVRGPLTSTCIRCQSHAGISKRPPVLAARCSRCGFAADRPP